VFPGVIEYVDLHRFLAHLDVGIVPHSRDLLTESMNPLKVYNYIAAGLPVVGTDVSNLGDVTPFLHSAATPDDFVEAIEQVLRDRPDRGDALRRRELLDRIDWATRVDRIAELMDTIT
jgi:teichuronic acid biosynthesis glycosyltransferase TuaH